MSVAVLVAASAAALAGAPAGATTTAASAPSAAVRTADPDWGRCAAGQPTRQEAFSRASRVSGVPRAILLGVSYLESRWDDHGASPSTSGGYGPLHLTAVESTPTSAPEVHHGGKGELGAPAPTSAAAPRARTSAMDETRLRTLDRAAELTGLAPRRLRTDDAANICGGAALLAAYQQESGVPVASLGDWSAAVARYSGARDEATALRFAREVYDVVNHGAARTTNDGQRVRLAPHATVVEVEQEAVASLALATSGEEHGTIGPDCTPALSCEAIYAPYEKTGEGPGDYGNHDLAERPDDLDLDYVVIHDTEATWDTTLDLVTNPEYVSWHYSLRSSDGRIAQHVPVDDPAWHAGNWYVNTHSIGLEHEGFAAEGAAWYTESLYRSSARLVRHLARTYDIPLDRAHVIGHDQVPGITPAHVAGMHWDPGPYWDWEHYFDLLGAPLDRTGVKPRGRHARAARMVTVAPGFDSNRQPVTGCDDDGTCPTQGTNFVYLRQHPSPDAPLVRDGGLRPGADASTTEVSDIGARATAGHRFRVAQRRGPWLGVWWLGDVAWLHNPASAPTVVPDRGRVVVARGQEAPVYGRAYPEASAYPEGITAQDVVPLQYTIERGQAYVVADADPATDYYYAKTFECAGSETVAEDCVVVAGRDRYLQVWFGHRLAYVRAADVVVRNGNAGGRGGGRVGGPPRG